MAVVGLTATTPIGVENVMCPSNATSPAECEVIAPPESRTCRYSDFSAAGVRCIQSIFTIEILYRYYYY